MAGRKHDFDLRSPSRHAFLIAVGWIAALLASYWVLADWQSLPAMISAAVAGL